TGEFGHRYAFYTLATDNVGHEQFAPEAAQETSLVQPNSQGFPPTLDPIPDQTVNEGSLLSFTARADDEDLPNDRLTFRLESPPRGASIDPDTGVFSWPPDDGPASVVLTVTVTDTDTPPQSVSQSFTVTVQNVAPRASFSGPASVALGSQATFRFTQQD